MKFAILASAVALASTAAALPSIPYPGCLAQFEADIIADKFISILEHQDYNGKSPNETAQSLIADDYTEVSDSILSLEKSPLGGLAASTKTEWIEGILHSPADTNITTYNVLVAGCNKILWQWKFPNIGPYEIKGFNLLHINQFFQVYQADIEFNSIAWGLDTHQLYQYCPTGN